MTLDVAAARLACRGRGTLVQLIDQTSNPRAYLIDIDQPLVALAVVINDVQQEPKFFVHRAERSNPTLTATLARFALRFAFFALRFDQHEVDATAKKEKGPRRMTRRGP
jgi:hypothetical protein